MGGRPGRTVRTGCVCMHSASTCCARCKPGRVYVSVWGWIAPPSARPCRPSGWKVDTHVHPSCCRTQTRPRDLFRVVGYLTDSWLDWQTAVRGLPRSRRGSGVLRNTLADLIGPCKKPECVDPSGVVAPLVRTLSAERGDSREHAGGFKGLFHCNGMWPSDHLSAHWVRFKSMPEFPYRTIFHTWPTLIPCCQICP